MRGTPAPAGLRFSSTVVRGIEIAIFAAKWDPVASVAGAVLVASAGVGERADVNPALDGDRRRPPWTATGHHPPDLRLPPFSPDPAENGAQ